MIENIPSASQYAKFAKDCILEAYTLISRTVDDDESSETVIHQQRTLRNAVILIHQGLEIFMKSVICEKSPLLIIDNKKKIGQLFQTLNQRILMIFIQFQVTI